MNRFGAQEFMQIAATLQKIEAWCTTTAKTPESNLLEIVSQDVFVKTAAALEHIGCNVSCASLKRIESDVASGSQGAISFAARIREVASTIQSEMALHLFLWVQPHHAEFYSKTAESVVGDECCTRFPSIKREVDEAVKCYAVGRFTASAFHLMRATEVVVKALAKAINAAPKHDAWRLVFEEMKSQVARPFGNRQKHWKTHGEFLHTIWADMCAVAKEWRNDLAHTVDIYSEEEAKQLLGVIPVFLRHGATKMDESGTLY